MMMMIIMMYVLVVLVTSIPRPKGKFLGAVRIIWNSSPILVCATSFAEEGGLNESDALDAVLFSVGDVFQLDE